MNTARDVFTLAILAFKEGKYDGAAKLFTTAMNSDGLDSFVSELTRDIGPLRAAVTSLVPSSENTLAPSLASGLPDIVELIESQFRAECSLVDDGDEEVEVRANLDEDDEDEDEDEGMVIACSVGPIGLK